MASIFVVGAGPSGCSAGYHLARNGHRVTLIDRRTFPRDKICGDAISQGAWQALAMMGLYPANLSSMAKRGCVPSPYNGLLLGAPDGAINVFNANLGGFCIPRYHFDNMLYEQAIAAGCQPIQRTVKSLSDLHDECDLIIDSRGVFGGEPNAIATRQYWEVPTDQITPHDREKMQIYFNDFLGPAYGWIFPLSHTGGVSRFNVGVGMWLVDLEKSKDNIKQLHGRFIQRNAQAQRLWSAAIEKDKVRGFYLAGAKLNNRVAEGKILKIGDAANLTDPMSGEGIQNAVLSGMLVANTINLSVSQNNIGQSWQEVYEGQFEDNWRWGLRVQSALRSKHMRNYLIRAMNKDIRIAKLINSVIYDLVRYNNLLPTLSRWLRRPAS